MRMEIFASSVALALIVLPLLAWKWHINIRTAIVGAVVIGGLTGLTVSQIDSSVPELNMTVLVLIELCLIVIMALIPIFVRFYRDPERFPAETENVILSPADGKVVYINEVDGGSSLVSTKGNRKFKLDEITSTNIIPNIKYLVGIDMNILNVHVNRSPISGKTILRKRIKGKFISLRRQDAEIVNERITTVIENGAFRIGVVQIASRLVRRIVSYVGEGDNLEAGQRLGAIIFGSQVDVAIPELENLEIEVNVGDEVKAGVSVIARYGYGRV